MNNKKSVLEIALKLSEEVGEVSEAVLIMNSTNGSTYKGSDVEQAKMDVMEESVDVMMVAMSLFAKLGGTQEMFDNILQHKSVKWDKVVNQD